MALDIRAIFEDAIDEFLTRKAATLLGVFLFVGVLSSVAGDSFALALIDAMVDAVRETEGSLPSDLNAQIDDQRSSLNWGIEVGLGTATLLLIGSFLLGELARIPAVRGLADTSTDTLDASHYATNVISIFVQRVLVAIITFILVAVTVVVTVVIPGAIFAPLSLLGIVPLLYVVIGLFFASYAVTIDEDTALDGIQRSWGYANGNRFRLVLIGIVVAVVTFLSAIPVGLLIESSGAGDAVGFAATVSRMPAALVVGAIVGAITTVFTIAVGAQTYNHLDRAAAPEDGGHDAELGPSDVDTEF